MKSNGFDIKNRDGQITVDFIMPAELKNIFSAALYGRGPIMDASDGNPESILKTLNKTGQIDPDAALVAPYQVHGTEVIYSSLDNSLPLRPKADAIFLDEKSNAFASLRFADCTPIVIAGTSPRPWMLLIHSGFVGTFKNITAHTVKSVSQNYNVSLNEKTWAWIAPSICRECYDRKSGDPLTGEGLKNFSAENIRKKNDYVQFDVQQEVELQLAKIGIPRENTFRLDNCTKCGEKRFYSYRGGDKEKRNFLIASNATNSFFE